MKKIILFVTSFALTAGAFHFAWANPSYWDKGVPVWALSLLGAYAIVGASLGIYNFLKDTLK